MNRKERRKAKADKPKVYTLTADQIKNAILNIPEVKEKVEKELNDLRLSVLEQCSLDVDTATMWTLHQIDGWGKIRLRRFYADMFQEHRRMRDFYQLQDLFPERYKLKEIGVDIEQWFREECDKEAERNAEIH